MLFEYYDFNIIKKGNFVRLSAQEHLILESAEDDNNLFHKRCGVLFELIQKKLSLDQYAIYNIYTLNVPSFNRITDHKKIWKLGGFETSGIFDGHYDCKDGRIYFGIFEGCPSTVPHPLVNQVAMYLPKGKRLNAELVFEFFAERQLNLSNANADSIEVLSFLQSAIEDSLLLYERPASTDIFLLGKDLELKFDSSDLPKTNIVERL